MNSMMPMGGMMHPMMPGMPPGQCCRQSLTYLNRLVNMNKSLFLVMD